MKRTLSQDLASSRRVTWASVLFSLSLFLI